MRSMPPESVLHPLTECERFTMVALRCLDAPDSLPEVERYRRLGVYRGHFVFALPSLRTALPEQGTVLSDRALAAPRRAHNRHIFESGSR